MLRKRFIKPLFQTAVCIIVIIAGGLYSSGASALLQTGSPAPEFSLKDLSGKETTLAEFSGKKAVVIFFWATWSANSPKALKRFEEFHKKYAQKGIQIIAINADNQTISEEDTAKIKAVVAGAGITFPVLLDSGLKTFREYDVIALPSTIVVTEGKLSYSLPGWPLAGTEDLFDYLLTLAGETPKKKAEGGYKPKHDAIADSNLAKGFVKKGKYAMAYPLYKKAIDKDPKYMLPYVELAKLYVLEGKNQEAEETLRSALKVEPENVIVVSELGYLLVNTKRTKEALEILSKPAKEESYTPALYYYAYALAVDGRMSEATPAFEKALQMNPFDPSAYRLRGMSYEMNNMKKEAAMDYRKALEILLKIRN